MKLTTRLRCGLCKWEKWIEHNPKLTNDEANELDKPVLEKHIKEIHGINQSLKLTHLSHERKRIN